jgi:hypothetical protein
VKNKLKMAAVVAAVVAETFALVGGAGVARAGLYYSASVAVGKFRGVGMPDDLAVATGEWGPVFVVLGNGDGTFQTPRVILRELSTSVAVSDFNGDGYADLASTDPFYLSSRVILLLSNGDGSFEEAGYFVAASSPWSVAVGQFRGDGAPDDLAVASYGSSAVSVLLGNGDGTFQAAQYFGVARGPQSVAVGDFNVDGVQDLARAKVLSSGLR